MNEEEEESPLEGPCVRRNRLARKRHAARSKEQRATDASRQEGQRACSAQRELNRANQGGNQVIPLARHEFDGNHHGLRHTLGEMTTMCGKCGALHFLEERVASSSRANPQFTPCYAQGKVTMPSLAPPPEPLRWLLTNNEADAKAFVSAFALTIMRWPSRLWGPTWIPVLPNLATILTVFAVNFTIGWGVFFLSLARRQNSPSYTLAIHMPSLMAEWAILAA